MPKQKKQTTPQRIAHLEKVLMNTYIRVEALTEIVKGLYETKLNPPIKEAKHDPNQTSITDEIKTMEVVDEEEVLPSTDLDCGMCSPTEGCVQADCQKDNI